jgi:quinol-cytochrome oxidoreductase complex cytochrome b subunit
MAKKSKANDPDDLAENVVAYARLVIVAIVCIYVVYKVAETLIGQLPASISAIIMGIVFIYIYVTNENVRNAISGWSRSNK